MDQPPVNSVMSLDDYARCGQYEGTPTEVSTIDCTAGTIGRYLYVYLPSSNSLTLCEVEVYGERKYPILPERNTFCARAMTEFYMMEI